MSWSGKLLCFAAFTEIRFRRTLNYIYIYTHICIYKEKLYIYIKKKIKQQSS